MKAKTEEILIITLALILLVGAVFILNPTIIGYVAYEPTLTYNLTLIDDTNNEYKLNQIITQTIVEETTTETSHIISAIRDGHDDTAKLQTLDGNSSNIDKDQIFDVTFDHELNNDDTIKMYLKQGEDTLDIYLCQTSTQCGSPGYGLTSFTGETGWYSITISNLPSPTSAFNIDPTKIKFDYIKAEYTITTYTNIIETSYAESATLESDFIEPANLANWDLLEKTETLNGQSILYQYTTDTTWNTIENFNLSYVDSTKIKFRITLQSDTTNTPILHSLTLNYLTEAQEENCTENWSCNNWLECINETQTRTCIDLNNCNTTLLKPIETQICTVNETNSNQETPPSSSGSSGGGGGSGISEGGPKRSLTPIVEVQEKQQETIELHEAEHQEKTIELPEEPLTMNIVKESTRSTTYYISILLLLILVISCYVGYKKLLKKLIKKK